MRHRRDVTPRRPTSPGVKSLVARYPMSAFLVMAHVIFWSCWTPILFLGAPPRAFSAVGAILGLALPALLVTAALGGRPAVRDLLRRTLRWRVGVGWYSFALFAIPLGAVLLAPLVLGMAPLQALSREWSLLFTVFIPQLLLALVTVQLFEEVAWSGLVQHTLQSRYGSLKGTVLVGVAFATLHLPTYLSTPITGRQVLQVLATQVVLIIPFAILFRSLVAWTYNGTGFSILLAALLHASFNTAAKIVGPVVIDPAVAQILGLCVTALLALAAALWSRGTLGYRRGSPAAGAS